MLATSGGSDAEAGGGSDAEAGGSTDAETGGATDAETHGSPGAETHGVTDGPPMASLEPMASLNGVEGEAFVIGKNTPPRKFGV